MSISKRELTKLRIRDAFIIFIGSTLMTIAVKYIFDPAGLVTGGVSGLAIVVKYVSDTMTNYAIPLWVTNVVLNIPIFLFAMKAEGKRSVVRTGLAWVIMSIELMILPDLNLFPEKNLFLVSVFGGILFGASTGILLLVRSTSGGTDLLGKALRVYFPQYSMGRIIQVLDGIVVILGAMTFSIENTLYAIVSVYITGKVADLIIDHGKRAKICLIISHENENIAKEILEELDRGVTRLTGTGMYSREDKTILFCVCSNRDLPDVKDIVKSHDKRAFFVIGNISEAMGEGFVEHWT